MIDLRGDPKQNSFVKVLENIKKRGKSCQEFEKEMWGKE
jgi:hypothetical protein